MKNIFQCIFSLFLFFFFFRFVFFSLFFFLSHTRPTHTHLPPTHPQKPFLSGLRSKCLSDLLCCMAWCHIRELVWNWLDSRSRLKVLAAGRDPWLQSGLDFGTAEIQNLLYILYIDEEHHANFESICWYLPSPSESSASFSYEC